MAKFIINHEDAAMLHKDFYSGNFEIIKGTRSGAFDVPPWSFFYGASDINGWDGLISTDGKKLVFSKGGYFKQGKITKHWEIDTEKLDSVSRGTFKTRFNFAEKVSGLTTKSFFEAILLLALAIVPFLIYKSKKVNFRIADDFGNLDSFFKLIDK